MRHGQVDGDRYCGKENLGADSLGKRLLRIVTRFRDVWIALSIEEYFQTHGERPATLDDLVPLVGTLPLDPRSDGPFTYRRTEGSYELFGTSPDGPDHWIFPVPER